MKITLGYIDKDSKKFKLFTKASSLISAAGGIAVFDSVTIPFVEILWRNHPVIRNLAHFGIISLSGLAGIASGAWTELTISNAVDLYNDFVSGLPYNGPEPEEIDIPEETEPKAVENDNLFDYRYTFFGDDADVKAHDIVIKLEAIIDENGVVTLNDLRAIQHRDALDGGDTLGWTKEDLYHSEIESVLSDDSRVGAILKLNRPHDISDHYVVIKPSGKKNEEE